MLNTGSVLGITPVFADGKGADQAVDAECPRPAVPQPGFVADQFQRLRVAGSGVSVAILCAEI
ncbi:MAG: hypothetical protein L0H70_08875, partial [Xanthomonadales bacterium]|nr:hypothetical protein [Xanthomonadales bacterium]